MPTQHASRDVRAQHFVDEATARHKGRFRYGKALAEYQSSKVPVTITCPTHGEFRQAPHDHLKGNGCPDCSRRRGSSQHSRAVAFIAAARRVHRNDYAYDESSFIDMHHAVRIECPTHGWFIQRATNHLRGQRCPRCARRRG